MSHFVKKEMRMQNQNREIYGVAYLPDVAGKYPLVIFSHGFNGTNAGFILHAEYLAQNGVGAFCLDFCGGSVHSKSGLTTAEMSIFTEKEDLCAVLSAVQKWERVDDKNIFLFGESQGGLVTALTADEKAEEIKGVLLLYPALCIADDWNARFPELESVPDTQEFWGVTLGRDFVVSLHGYDVFEHIGKYNKNVLIFHGDKDEIVSLSYGERAFALYPHAVLEVFKGEGHGFSQAGNKKVAEMTLGFVKENI